MRLALRRPADERLPKKQPVLLFSERLPLNVYSKVRYLFMDEPQGPRDLHHRRCKD